MKRIEMNTARIFPGIAFFFLMLFHQGYGQKLTQKEKWDLKLDAYSQKDGASPPPDHVILFIGSSTIEGWKTLESDFAGKHVMNRGIAGTKMVDLYHFRERLIKPYRPCKIFIYEGDNDIALGWTPDSICNVFQQLFHYIRNEKPEATIYVMSIKPSPSREKYKEDLLLTNKLLKAFITSQRNAGYIDMYTPMLKKGTYVPSYYKNDNLHLTAEGYECWKKIISPYILNQK